MRGAERSMQANTSLCFIQNIRKPAGAATQAGTGHASSDEDWPANVVTTSGQAPVTGYHNSLFISCLSGICTTFVVVM